jgi:hypothetical protein
MVVTGNNDVKTRRPGEAINSAAQLSPGRRSLTCCLPSPPTPRLLANPLITVPYGVPSDREQDVMK